MFEQAFRNIDDVLRKEAGCTTELDYTEQTSWLLFLKYLDDLERDRATVAELKGERYVWILDERFRWESWAAPKDANGKLDHHRALSGDDLRGFVDDKLFPYLQGFTQRASGPDTIEYKIGEIFGEIKNKVRSGYNLREIVDTIDALRFRSQAEKHELSHLYEAKIRNMGNAGRNGGEYYTPRPLIRAMVRVVAPRIGERVYDGACGSAGFLCEAFDWMKAKPGLSTADLATLQERTFYGREKKSLAYVIAIMNMILHGIEAPNITHANTLAKDVRDIQESERVEVILANPPFGGKERKEVQQNFRIKTGETAFLFLEHFIAMLKAGGRAGIVIKNTFLSNTDNASVALRQKLLNDCNLHSVLDCPGGTFQGAGVKTVVLFFAKGAPTRKIWYYQLDPGRNLGKTNPLNDADMAEFVELQKSFADSPKSWSVDASTIDTQTFDLSVKNPNAAQTVQHRLPREILDEIAALDVESADVLVGIGGPHEPAFDVDGWDEKPFEDCIEDVTYTNKIQRKHFLDEGEYPVISQEDAFINGYWDNAGDVFRVDRPLVLFGDHTKALKYVDFDFVLGADGVKILKPKLFLHPRFFYHQLRSAKLESLGYARHYKLLKELAIRYPSLEEQQRIARELDDADEQVERLEFLYTRKLAALDELKQSLLQQAFSGVL